MIFGKYVNLYYRKYWYLFVLVFLADTIVDFAQLLIPIMVGRIITKIENGAFVLVPEDGLWYHSDLTTSLLFLAVIALIIVVGRIGWRYFSTHIAAHVERDMRKALFHKTEKLPLTYFKDKKVGGLLSYFTNDLQTIKSLFNECIIWMTDLVVLGTLTFVLMMLMSWPITLITSLPLLCFSAFGYFVGKAEADRFRKANDAYEDLSDFAEENLQGFSVLKAFRKERIRQKEFVRLATIAADTSVRYQRYSTLIDLGINFFLTATFSLLMGLGTYSILSRNPSMAYQITDVGALTTFVGFYDTLTWPMIAGGLLIDYISRGRGAYRRLAEVFDAPEEDEEGTISEATLQGEVRFDHLSFSYPDQEEGESNLQDISFHVLPGMTVGLIGRTSSGKSTLLTLLDRLYPIERGRVFLDGRDINDYARSLLRRQIGLVSQQAFLFSGPLWQSVAFAEDDPKKVDWAKVASACRFACIDKDIEENFPQGYETFIGEKGATVSGGQRQRLSIARAIYKNPPILILDDSLSAVDADTEQRILRNIQQERKGRTTFIIAHRISAIERADWILVLDRGRIVGQGTHEDLLKSCPLYQDIQSLQELEKEVAR